MKLTDPITNCPACGTPIVPEVGADFWCLYCPCGNEWERSSAPTVADMFDQCFDGFPAFRQQIEGAMDELRRELAAWRDQPEGGDDLGFIRDSGGWSRGIGEPDEYGDYAAYWVVSIFTDGRIDVAEYVPVRLGRVLRDQDSIRGAMRAALGAG